MVLISALNHRLNHCHRPSAFCRMSKRSLTAHSPSMDSHNLVNYAHQFFKHLFIQLGKNNLPQLTSVFFVNCSSDGPVKRTSIDTQDDTLADGCCSWTADDKRLLPLPFPTVLLLSMENTKIRRVPCIFSEA